MSTTIKINDKTQTVEATPDTPLLWVLRGDLKMTSTKFGCGIGMCGACTVHLNGQAVRACSTPLSAAVGKKVTTIEGIGASKTGSAVQAAWVKIDVPQCGYCQSGQIMSACALLGSCENAAARMSVGGRRSCVAAEASDNRVGGAGGGPQCPRQRRRPQRRFSRSRHAPALVCN